MTEPERSLPAETQLPGETQPPEQEWTAFWAAHRVRDYDELRAQYAEITGGRDVHIDWLVMQHGGPGSRAQRLKAAAAVLAAEYRRLGADLGEWIDAQAAAWALALEGADGD